MRAVVLVAVGGAAGAAIRWWVGDLLAGDLRSFPWATFVVNVAGCVAIGLAARRLPRGGDAWNALVVGVLGGLTTYSAFAVEARTLVDVGRPGVAAVYVALSVGIGVGAVELAKRGTP